LVERKLPKLEVAGSTPVRRFRFSAPEPNLRAFNTRVFEATESKVLETIRTALVVNAAPEAVTFAHRSLAEYCAGACLAYANLGAEKFASLLFAGSAAEGRLIPELREIAAWAADLSSAERLERWDRRIWRSLAALDHPLHKNSYRASHVVVCFGTGGLTAR
jgi:hypothetical protein